MSNKSKASLVFSVENVENHRQWVEAGFVGEGRIEVFDKDLSEAGKSSLIGIRGANLSQIRLVRCDLKNSDFTYCDLIGGELSECIWNNSDIYGCNFDEAIINNCDFANVQFTRTHFIRTRIEGGDWSNSNLELPTWTKARVKDVNFSKSHFPRARMYAAHFINCDFQDSDLSFAEPFKAYFENCDFRGANFKNFKLKYTTFKQCGFYACYDTPEFVSSFQIIEPDLSVEFDGSNIVDKNRIIELWQNNAPAPQPPKETEPEKTIIELKLSDLVSWRPKMRDFDSNNLNHRAVVIDAVNTLIDKYIHTAIDLMEGIEGQDSPFDDWIWVFSEFEEIDHFPGWEITFDQLLPAEEGKPNDEKIKWALSFLEIEMATSERRETFYRYWAADKASDSIRSMLRCLTAYSCPPSKNLAVKEIEYLEKILENSILPWKVETAISEAITNLRDWISKMENSQVQPLQKIVR
ncbi:MAG: pentapeptide repeat-containing protein [Prochloraceae cyanobacterium]